MSKDNACLLEAIYCCDAVSDIYLTAIMTAEGIKFIPAIFTLLDAAGALFSCLIQKSILQELMHLTSICLEVGAA